MRDQFDNYEKRIVEKLDREAEEIERRIDKNPQAAEAKANESLDRKVYAGVAAYEKAVAGKNEVSRTETDRRSDILAGLSPNDAEALCLGWELQRSLREEEDKEEPEKTEKTERKHTGVWKRFAAAVVVLVMVTGFGVNSIGGPTRIVEMMGFKIGGREISQGNSSVNTGKLTEEDIEEEAYQQIKEELGIDAVRIRAISKKMKYKSSDIDLEIRLAQMLYMCENRNISYLISDSYTEEFWSSDIEDKKTDEYTFDYGKLNAEVTEYELPESGEKEYTAKFVYKGIHYQITAVIEKSDFEKILKNLYFY